MEQLGQEHLIEFWKEVISETRSITDPTFLDFLQSVDAHRVWNSASDDNAKSYLNMVNRLLNEAKSRALGLTLLNQFISQFDSNRYLIVQDILSSALHIVTKFVDQELVQKLFVSLLPRCHDVLQLNQTVSNSIIPKILSYLSLASATSSNRSLSSEEIRLLKVCLVHFHGPCGNHRNNLEKILLPLIDSDGTNDGALRILPLLSASGSGGNKRDKHGQDWYAMNIRILNAMQGTIVQLYTDACPSIEEYNPYETEFGTLDLPGIHEKDVLRRYSLLAKRLKNLSALLGYYLSEPFPAAKPIPSRSILNIVCKMIFLNPVDLLRSKGPKEHIYLAGIVPSLHESALRLLSNLIFSVGPNILPEAGRIEQLALQEFKWLSKAPQGFINVKLELYQMLLKWLDLTNGMCTTRKTLVGWMAHVQSHITIERTSVALNLKSSKSKGSSGKKNSNRVSAQTQSLTSLLTTNEKAVVEKNSDLCAMSLKFLEKLLPSLDDETHKVAYVLLARTVAEFSQDPKFPNPYDSENCRINIFKCILCLALNPLPKSPVSLGVLTNLVDQGLTDSSYAVVEVCQQILSCIEKIAHPVGPTFEFPSVFTNSESNSNELNNDMDVSNLQDDSTALRTPTTDSFCQTEESAPVREDSDTGPISSRIPASLTYAIESTVRKSMERLLSEMPNRAQTSRQMYFQDDVTPNHKAANISISTSPATSNGIGKRRADSDSSDHDSDEQSGSTIEVSKKSKLREPEDNEPANTDCAEWLNDFVNMSPDRS